MNYRVLFSFLCGFMFTTATWQGFAQDNTTRATAQEIILGEQIITQFTPGTVEHLWYKISATAGKWYEIPHRPHALKIYKNDEFYEWYGYSYNDSYDDFRAIQFKAEATEFYYIERFYNSSVGDRLEWSMIEVTDNRVCSNAETIQIGLTANVPAGQNERWYKAAHKANQHYVVDASMLTSVLESCDGMLLAKGKQVYHTGNAADMYFKFVGAIQQGGTLKVREISAQTNISKETALSLSLGQDIEYSHIFGQTLYFKISLEKGKVYEIIADNPNQFYQSMLSVSDSEGNEIPNIDQAVSVSPAGESRWFTAPSTGDFYIRRFKYDSFNNNHLYVMRVNEIIDARICSNAITAAENQTMTYHHKDYLKHWWKIDLEAGNTYLVDLVNEHGSNNKMGVFTECDNENSLGQDNKSFSFVATKTGTYYLQATAEIRQHDDQQNSFTIRKIVNQNNFNCTSALAIEPGNAITTNHGFGNNLWYKINVKAGKTYEIDGRQRISSWSDVVRVFTACGQTNPVYASSSNPVLLYLTPTTDGIYYICWLGDTSIGAFTWQINEVTDNRICSMAETAPIGQDIAIIRNSHANNTHWYRLNMQGGKVYEIDFSNAEKNLYTSDEMKFYGKCGPNEAYAVNIKKSKHLLAPTKDSVLYLKISLNRFSSLTEPLVWRINEASTADNRLCSHATPVSLNTDIQTDHTPGYTEQWYKITLESNKIYEVDASQATNNLYYYQGGDICNTQIHYDNLILSQNKILIAPAETSEYYFLSRDENTNNKFTWKIKESEGDNRLRAFATEVMPGTEFSVNHMQSSVRWYKVNMAEGALYTINFRANHQNVYVFNDNKPDSVLKSGYGQTFTFLAKTGGMHYLKFENISMKLEFNCTVEGIVDNRSCLYPLPVTIGTTTSGTGLDSDGRWFSVNLNEGSIYEFDFTNISQSVTTICRIYTACTDSKPLDEEQSNKLLFKPTQTGDYLVHISTVNGVTPSTAWSWSFNTGTADNRMCEYATAVNPGDTTTIDLNNGIGRRWYKVAIQGGKFYEIGTENSQYAYIEVYADCGANKVLTTLAGNKKMLSPEGNTTLYVKASSGNNARWYIKEVPSEGRRCYEGVEIQLGTEITTTGNGVEFNFTPTGYTYPLRVYNGAWYKISNLEAGVYEARLEQWKEYEDEYYNDDSQNGYYYGPFFYVHVFGNCDAASTSYLGSAGHGFNRGRVRFQINSNQTCYFLLSNESHLQSFKWEIVKVETSQEKGIVRVSLEDSNNQPLANVSDAGIYIYRKQGNTLTLVDQAAWDPAADNFAGSTFSSLPLNVGTYLVYVDNVPGHLPGWYQNAGVWEDATEINLTKQGVSAKYTPKVAPTDIATGDISISGSVYKDESGGQITIQDIDICIYREKPQAQGILRRVTSAPYRVINSTNWELIARIKTDAQGKYQLDNLPAGRYMIMVDLPGYSSENSGIVINASAGENYDDNNFKKDESSMTIVQIVSGLIQTNTSGINLFPNPFDREVTIIGAKGAWLQVFNAKGACIYSHLSAEDRETLNLNELPTGIYCFRIEKGGKTESFVTIKK